jgi:hypothetical protein
MPKLSFLSARIFDAGLAALAAASAGFVAFAMPGSLFASLVETSRLPRFLPAAQPPLGDTARLAAAGAASLLTFAAVWALMALLGRAPAKRRPRAEAEVEAEAPKLRRADAHPDAPARRPLLARDLGEPLELDDFHEAPAGDEPATAEPEHRPLPAFLVAQATEPEAAAEPGLEPEPEPGPRPDETETRLDEPEPEPEAEPQPQPQPQPQWTPYEPDRAQAEPEPEPSTEWQPAPRVEPPAISELAAQLPEAEEEDSGQSLSQLVNRIEFGLSRKRQALPAAADASPVEEGPEEKVGHRLRSAINDLQKIASTGG